SNHYKKKNTEPPKLKLKTLPPSLKYIYLNTNNTQPVIINSNLNKKQKEKLIQILETTQEYHKLNTYRFKRN
ncbi:hypothetical protein DF186_22220, partial [Enterococcus hirae]